MAPSDRARSAVRSYSNPHFGALRQIIIEAVTGAETTPDIESWTNLLWLGWLYPPNRGPSCRADADSFFFGPCLGAGCLDHAGRKWVQAEAVSPDPRPDQTELGSDAMLSHWWIGLLALAPDRLTLEDAISSALTRNPAILVERETVRRAEGARELAEGPFDFIVDSRIGHLRHYTPYTETVAQLDNITHFRLGLSKQLPFGLIIEPSIELYRSESVIPRVVSSTVPPQNVAVLRLLLRQPILRGFGAAASAEVDAAEQIALAARHEARQIAAERVLSVAIAYWRWAGALRAVAALVEAEQRAEQMVRDGRELVAADQRPRADLEPLEASRADRVRIRLLAEQDALDARARLALEMGLGPEEMEALAPIAIELPQPIPIEPLSPSEVEASLARRDDLKAAKLKIAAARILVDASRNAALPQLDLEAEVGYAGIVEGSSFKRVFEPIVRNVPGVNAGAGLVLRWPVESSAASGELAFAVAERRRAEIERDDLIRRARTGLSLAEKNLRISLEALERAREAHAHYRAAVENERLKMKSGHATVIDVITTEDRTSSTNLAEIAAYVSYATLLAELAYASGDLIRGEGEEVEVNVGRLGSPRTPGR